jgi:ABC-type arginine/histidine transport system permease subunit
VQEWIDLSRLLSKDTQLLLLQLYCIYGGTGSTRLLPALSLHAEIFRDAMRDVFGIFFVAFITGTPLCHFAPLSLLKAE